MKPSAPAFFATLTLLFTSSISLAESLRTLSTSRFATVTLAPSKIPAEGFALQFLKETTPSLEEETITNLLSKKGWNVAQVSLAEYLKQVAGDDQECSYFAGEIEHLSQLLQKNWGEKEYKRPLLVGIGGSSGFVYTVLAESPKSFVGGLTLDFCPEIAAPKPLCSQDQPPSSYNKRTITVEPTTSLTSPFIAVNRSSLKCTASSLKAFSFNVPNTTLVTISGEAAPKAIDQALDSLRGAAKVEVAAPEKSPEKKPDIADLPILNLRPEVTPRNVLVLFLSGDGGWATIDKELGRYLAENGYHVVGFDSLKYFWQRKDPLRLARDIESVLQHYTLSAHPEKIVLLGYSFGADVLPFAINKLSENIKVDFVALLNPGKATDFEVQLTDWLGMDNDDSGLPIEPELRKISAPLLCVYASDEADESLCHNLKGPFKSPKVEIEMRTGSHHFDGDYHGLAALLIDRISKISAGVQVTSGVSPK